MKPAMDATGKQAVIDRNVDRLRREAPEDFAFIGEKDVRYALGVLVDDPDILTAGPGDASPADIDFIATYY